MKKRSVIILSILILFSINSPVFANKKSNDGVKLAGGIINLVKQVVAPTAVAPIAPIAPVQVVTVQPVPIQPVQITSMHLVEVQPVMIAPRPVMIPVQVYKPLPMKPLGHRDYRSKK